MNRLLLLSFILCLLPGTLLAQEPPPPKQHWTSEATARLALPFSEAVRVGKMLYLSGMVGNRPGEMAVVAGGIEAETRQAMSNIQTTLAAFGATMQDLVKCTVMLADIAEWPRMNSVYVTFFEPPYPARSAFAATGLALGARVEIECIAVLPD